MLKKGWDFAWGFYKKYEELVNYLISGVLGVVVSISSYWLCRQVGFDIVVSNSVSWVIAVIFMYILNRVFVFKSKSEKIAKEFLSFALARVFTLLLETAVIFLVVDVFSGNDMVGKVLGQIVVIITNYILSKFIIFKKDSKKASKK